MDQKLKDEALEYHRNPAGKIALCPTKPLDTQKHLSLAYTPGVAAPCLEIKEDVERVWEYTARGNMVAVVSDGTAVLGLGNIGPEAGLPVMEGKSVLFKKFADVDTFPIVLQHVKKDGQPDIDKIVEVVKAIEPSFGGVNLEDIKAPQCFDIERRLKKETKIPIFHDDQHGTAIISLAGLLNSLELLRKDIDKVKVVFNGAGASALATARYYVSVGMARQNITMCDSKGVIHSGREDLNEHKKEFAKETSARTLSDALVGADIFVGLSVGGVLTQEMIKKMADDPMVVAMANPYPEIMPEDAKAAGAKIIATGRSDYPNQINNVLGFPGIFRGAIDVRATDITEDMKRAASEALASLVKEPMPSGVRTYLEVAYPNAAATGMFDGDNPLSYDYIIPKPLDPRVVPRVARFVAHAAIETGVARSKIVDFDAYEASVAKRIDGLD